MTDEQPIEIQRCPLCGYADPTHAETCVRLADRRTTMPRVIRDVNPNLLEIVGMLLALLIVCCGGAYLTIADWVN